MLIEPLQSLHPLGHKLGVIVLISAVSDSWGLFKQISFLKKKMYENLYPGGSQSLLIAITTDFWMIQVKYICYRKLRFGEF